MSYPPSSGNRNEWFWRILLVVLGAGLICALLASCAPLDAILMPPEPGAQPPIGDIVEDLGHGTSWGPIAGAILTLVGAAYYYIRRKRRKATP